MKSEWDVLRDDDGNPITITPKQMQAVWRAIGVVEAVRRSEGYESMFATGMQTHANLGKSRLLGRMLIDGKAPLDELPPTYLSARGYHLVEPEGSHWYVGSVFPVIVKDGVAHIDGEAMSRPA